MDVQIIIKAFGGLTQMSRMLNIPITTIFSWKTHNKIPSWRIDVIKQKAKELNINLPLDNQENQNK